MNGFLSKVSELDRRRFIELAAKSILGVSILPILAQKNVAQEVPSLGTGKAKRLIYLFMSGGVSHLDTFDLKPGHESQGETRPIQTSVPGTQVGHLLPTIASQFDQLTVVRSLHTQTGDHEAGEYLMRTSYEAIASERHPSIGPWLQQLQGRQNKSLPDTIIIGAPARHPGAGFFDPSFSPLPIGDPSRGLENTSAPEYLTLESFEKRITLIDRFDKKFREKYRVKKVQAYTDFYSEATNLLSSGELQAFDLNKEKNEDRDRYGRDPFGQGCLLARRLIENNVPCVEVTCGGWDMHSGIYKSDALPARAGLLDRAFGNLIKDLSERSLLDETLVVLTTEFGRSPKFNFNIGRDHHPAAFSSVLAGGGFKGGQYYGRSDAAGHGVEQDGVSPADFNATIAAALGLPLDKVVHSPTGRPFTVANSGKPIAQRFS